MANPKINGTLAPVLQPARISFDPTRGQVIELPYESAGPNLAGVAASFAASLISYDWEVGNAKSKITGRASSSQLGYPDVICDTWQLLANELQNDIKTHPRFLAMEENFPNTIGYVVRDVNLYNQGQMPGTPAPAGGAAADAALLFNLLTRGITHYATSQYVLRHTTNVSNVYAANIADAYVEYVYTVAQLLTEIGASGGWTFPCPGRLQYKIQTIPTPAARSNFLWGWRKLASTEVTSATNRIEISAEYWLGQWGIPPYTAHP